MEKKQLRAGLYLRISTGEQNMQGQELELMEYARHRGWEVAKIYRDTISGAKDCRPALNELMTDARRRKLDIVLVWRFDRFARSVTHFAERTRTIPFRRD
jgi:Site-specific recombinases, DNA invertase Pin homologs